MSTSGQPHRAKMYATKTWFGYVHIALGLAVAAQFVASPTYDVDTSNAVWDVISVLMAAGTVSALAFSLARVRAPDRSRTQLDIGAVAMLIASACLFLLYYRLWLAWWVFDAAETPPADLLQVMWYGIDVLFVVVNIAVGRYLLRTARSD